MNKIPMLEQFAAQSLVEHGGELIFSKEKFAELIVQECAKLSKHHMINGKEMAISWTALPDYVKDKILKNFGVE